MMLDARIIVKYLWPYALAAVLIAFAYVANSLYQAGIKKCQNDVVLKIVEVKNEQARAIVNVPADRAGGIRLLNDGQY